LEHIEKLVATVSVPVQMGGGIRNEEAALAAFEAGVSRIVLGTKAAQDPGFVSEMVARYGEKIVVSVDARGGKVAVDGWTGVTSVEAADALRQMRELGVKTAIYTPIEVDGMEQGPQLEELRAAADASSLQLIYASGVGTLEHLRAIAALRVPNLSGVIVGTALYKGNFKVHEAEAALAEGAGALSAA
jgi:phosphoribosylformimino-5-aminoimidazole carboxamide ribotide isomerase